MCSVVQIGVSDLPSDLAHLRALVKSTFNGGLTYLVVKTPQGWAGGKHVGGGVFRAD